MKALIISIWEISNTLISCYVYYLENLAYKKVKKYESKLLYVSKIILNNKNTYDAIYLIKIIGEYINENTNKFKTTRERHLKNFILLARFI